MYRTNLTQFLDDTVTAYPERAAVIDGETVLSFRRLKGRALKLASLVAERLGEQKKHVAAVFVPKGADSVTADVAIAYSSNAFINLDIKHPEQRFRNIFENVRPDLLITRRDVADRILAVDGDIPVLYIEDSDAMPDPDTARIQELLERRDGCLDTDLLCVINTSGSTGTPKGVAGHHRAFIDLIESEVRRGELDDTHEILASIVPCVFDRHIFEVCLMMMRAATLLIVPEHFAAFPVRMLELIVRHKATFLFWTPTLMVNIANMDLLSRIPLPSLRKIWFGGEVFPTAKFNYWRRYLPQVMFVNSYGPTEVLIHCAHYVVDRELRDDEPIPIGRALPNREILLIDEEGRQVKQGEEGEICVRGICLAAGYYNSPEKTAAAFVQNPLNSAYPEQLYRTGDIGMLNEWGELVFKGRRDTLIKHMGYRIELGEVEHVITGRLEAVRNCCALYNYAEKKITLFYESPEALDERDLRTRIGGILPRYMVPAAYVHMTEMPRNTNGKIDRLSLKQRLERSIQSV